MSPTRSLWPTAILLSFCTFSEAWVLHRKINDNKQVEEHIAPVELRHSSAQRRGFQERQDTELFCPEDRWSAFLNNNPDYRIKTFCNEWLGIGPTTTVVEYTPTITVTTSAEALTTTTSTTRLVTTQTVTQTATTTLAPILPRAANIAAVAEEIINSVIVSGTTSEATSTKNAQRLQAESGLANACSCKMVEPTATVTESYALPPVYTTVGYRVLILAKVTETRKFTAMTTVTEFSGASQVASSSTSTSAIYSASSASPSTNPIASASSVASISASTVISKISSSSVQSSPEITSVPTNGTAGSSNSSTPVVIAAPFRCPEAGNKHVEQVVGGFKLDYLVYCNTEIISQDRVGRPVEVDNETACTAQCSLVNAKSGQDTCKAAAFTPHTDGRSGGNCILSGPDPEYADKPGAVAVVQTGVSSNEDDCDAMESAQKSSKSIDTSALFASITSASFAISAPGLLTQTADGGVSETYVSANSTDAGGTVHWSWYRVSASSSYWLAVYGTSWSCTRTIPQTIVQHPPTDTPVPVTTVLITTIINGATTTIISGTSTKTVYGDNGQFPPTFVPASVTSENGEFTTFFSTATQTSTGASGIIPPTTGSVAALTLPIASPQASTIQGSANITLSGGTSVFTSTGSGGIIGPSSNAVPSSNSTFVSFVNTTIIVSLGSAQFTTSSSTLTILSTGGDGSNPPAPTNATIATAPATHTTNSTVVAATIGTESSRVASQSILVSSNSSVSTTTPPQPAVTVLSGSSVWTLSGSLVTANSTGLSGIIPPNPVSSSSIIPSVSVISGGGNITVSDSTFVAVSTGASGAIPPASSLSNTTSASKPQATPSSTGGIANVTTPESSSAAPATSASSVIPPPSANVSTSAPAPSLTSILNGTVIVSSGVRVFSTSGSTAANFSTGFSGVIPPPSSSTASALPPNSTLALFPNTTVLTGIEIVSTFVKTTTILQTFTSGFIPPSSANSTQSNSIIIVPTPVVNISSTGGVNNITIQGSTGIIKTTGDSGIIVPTTVAPSLIPSPSLNISSSRRSGSISGDNRSPFPFTSSLRPSSNSTGIPPSLTPSPSGNTSFPTGSGSLFSLSSSFSLPANSSIFSPSATPVPSLNATSTRLRGTNSDRDRSPFPFATPSSGTVTVTSNFTLSVPTAASSGIPPVSINSTSSINSTIRSGTFTQITPTLNISIPLSTGVTIVLSSISVPFSNVTSNPPTTTETLVIPPFGNSTVPTGTGFTVASVSSSAAPLNSTVPTTQSFANITSVPSATPIVSLNVTVPPVPTGNSSIPPYLNSSMPSICPTVPITVTEVSIATSIQLITTTIVETVTAAVVNAETVIAEAVTDGPSATLNLVIPTATPSPVVPVDLETRARARGEPATQPQIELACANAKNIVLNPNFSQGEDATVPGWDVGGEDPAIKLDSILAPSGNETIAQISSAAAGRQLSLSQPLTLCPGKQYSFSALARQGNKLADCAVEYSTVTNDGKTKSILNVKPQESWLSKDAFFTAGDDAAVDLVVAAKCNGFMGLVVSDTEGWMRVEVQGISVIRDE